MITNTNFACLFGAVHFLSINSYAFSYSESVVNFADVPCGRVPGSPTTSHLKGQNRRARIVGGSTAFPDEFPMAASIQDENQVHFCGGFTINRRFVLSAAHCFIYYMHGLITEENIRNMSIVVGTNDLKNPNESYQKMKIKRLHLHPNFSYLYPDFENDIALIEVDRDVKWSKSVQPVCLLKSVSDSVDEPHVSGRDEEADRVLRSVVAGWGVRVEDQPAKEWKEEMTLKKVDLPLWKNKDCQKAYNKYGIDWRTKDSHICAGYIDGKSDTCYGDSGSALLIKDPKDDIWIARGLVSAGEGCARPGIPGIYTRISHFIPFILSVISS